MGKTKWGIGGNEIHSDNIFSIRKISIQQLINDYHLNKIIIPDFQREQDLVKIKSIYKNHKKKAKIGENWLMQQGSLTICVLELDNKKYRLYLIDGQHRLLAMDKLLKKKIITDEEILIQMKKCNNIKEIKQYFKTININSKIELQYQQIENDFYDLLITNFKKKIKSLYPNAFSKTRNTSKNYQFYHIDEFLEMFDLKKMRETEFVKEDNKLDIDLLLQKICNLNLEIYDKYNLIKKNSDISNYLYKTSLNKLEKSGFYLALKNVKWIDYLLGKKENLLIIPQKVKKQKIPKRIRIQVWEKRFGDMGKGGCYCCKNIIDKTEFHAGHIIPEFKGGSIEINNLEPICGSCNSSMGTEDMHSFIKKYYPIKEENI